MADEVRVRAGLEITSEHLQYGARPIEVNADMTGRKGPSPGAITVTTDGTDVDFGELTTPGFVWMINLDPTNFVEWGIWEPSGSIFYPLGQLRPGVPAVFEFSRNLQEQYAGTGTGTTGPTNRFRLKANTAACVVRVDAFEK